MKLGFRNGLNEPKIAKSWFVAAIGALWIFGGTAPVVAQDMSFDLEEAEGAGGEAEAGGEADKPKKEGEAKGEASTEGEGEAEAGAAASSGDVLAELTAEGGPTEEKIEGGIQRETEAAEEIYAVQRMYVIRSGRFELAPSYASTLNDQYVTHPGLSVGLNYWVTNVLAIGVNFLWYQGIESESDLNFSVRRSTRLAVPITEYQLGAHLNFTYVPIYGKFTMFDSFIFQWDSYIIGGVGMMRTRPVAVVDPAVRSFEFDWRLAFNAGIGIRVFLTRWLTIFSELRDYMYLEKLENLNVELGMARTDEKTWIDKESTLTNNVTLQAGVTLYFPFSFDYRYPK
jgi:outer membrane beta-barrel protein